MLAFVICGCENISWFAGGQCYSNAIEKTDFAAGIDVAWAHSLSVSARMLIAHVLVQIANIMQKLQLLREIGLIVIGHVEQWGRQMTKRGGT